GGNMEGPLVEPSLQSFISIASIPLRHGMTIGELALYFNGRLFDNKVSLYVVALKNYTRNKEDFIFLAPLSPNLPTLASLYGYSFLGLLGEVKPFKVGVGTTSAFQRLELPINVKQSSVFFKNVENALQKMQIPVKKIQYTNQKSKKYIGLQFLLDHTVSWSTMELLVLIFQEAKKGNIPLTFSPSFNKAFGSDLLQKAVQESKIDAHVLQAIKKQTEQFYKQAKKFFLYKPYPQLVHTDR
ncbi:MAG TPA: exo-beta-N-acetylmuramidase NamZ domain-containing protein, partial [Patescibacteria group bacterium]|nr:exo-beta-N-acetylmuramidase NamZ domain-containing protein [Patescibacteria group bacterium]